MRIFGYFVAILLLVSLISCSAGTEIGNGNEPKEPAEGKDKKEQSPQKKPDESNNTTSQGASSPPPSFSAEDVAFILAGPCRPTLANGNWGLKSAVRKIGEVTTSTEPNSDKKIEINLTTKLIVFIKPNGSNTNESGQAIQWKQTCTVQDSSTVRVKTDTHSFVVNYDLPNQVPQKISVRENDQIVLTIER